MFSIEIFIEKFKHEVGKKNDIENPVASWIIALFEVWDYQDCEAGQKLPIFHWSAFVQ